MSKAESSSPRLKLVIRRLPPTLPEETFWQAVAPFVTPESSTWKRFIKGRANVGLYDHAVHSRAYVLMKSPEDLVKFHRGFDGHVFRSKTGIEYQAVVEYAPVQKTPLATKAKQDARQGTIDDDPDYKSYLESLQAPPPKPVIEPSLPVSQPTSTPLLEYLRTQNIPGAKGKKKQKTDSSSTDVARNAAAAVTASAARRNPKDQGAALIAGKGRAVVAVKPEQEAKEKPAKQRTKKPKVPKVATVPPPSNTAKNFPALGGPSTPATIPASNKTTLAKPIIEAKQSQRPTPEARPADTPKPTSIPPSLADNAKERTATPGQIAGRGRGRGGQNNAQRGIGQRGRGGAAASRDEVPKPDSSVQGVPESARGTGRGRGRGEPRVRSARGMVTGILSRNAKGEGASGGDPSGRAIPPPISARIDA